MEPTLNSTYNSLYIAVVTEIKFFFKIKIMFAFMFLFQKTCILSDPEFSHVWPPWEGVRW